MRTKIQVQHLRKGDQLSSGTVVGPPIHYGTYLGQKNRMAVLLQYGETLGSLRTAIWGKYTTVTVLNR